MAVYFGQAFYPGWDGGMSLEGFNKTVNIGETQSGINELPVIYLNSGLSPSQVGVTQHIASDFDNGQYPAEVSTAGRKSQALLAAVEPYD